MARSDKKIIRVRHVQGYGVAIVAEVGDDDDGLSGKAQETKNGKIYLGGADSFWLVTGEKKEPHLAPRSEDLQVPVFNTATSALVGRIKGTPNFSKEMQKLGGTGKPDAVSFATATRLTVGYSPRDMSHKDLVERLRAGRLDIPSQGTVDAIEVRPKTWLVSGFIRQTSGSYGLSPQVPIRAVQSVAIEGKPDWIQLASGLSVFRSPPKWSPATEADLRPDEEILRSAEEWLARAAAAASQADGSGPIDLAGLLKARIAGTVGTDEREDLASALRVLSSRASLLEVIPQLLSHDPDWHKKLQDFEGAERERLSKEVGERLESEAEEERKRLEELRIQVADAETRLVSAAHREVLLRNESEKHEAMLQEKIAEAARRLENGHSGQSQALLAEVGRLRAEVAELARAAEKASAAEVPPPLAVTAAPAAPPPAPAATAEEAPAMANDETRLRILRELANDSGLSLAEVVGVLLHSTEDFPVLLGERAAVVAAHFAAAVGGSDAAVVFCDPTRISLSDLLGDELSGFAKAVETARKRPDVLVPVAFCGITNGPCEYWLPQIVEMRRLGRIPRNTAFIASAGTDGMRVSVPKSALRYLFPIRVADGTKSPVGNRFAGHWPIVGKGSSERLQEALDLLTSGKDIEPDFLAAVAKMLSRMPAPSGLKMADVAAVLLRQGEWNEALETSAEDGNLRFFKDIGG